MANRLSNRGMAKSDGHIARKERQTNRGAIRRTAAIRNFLGSMKRGSACRAYTCQILIFELNDQMRVRGGGGFEGFF